MVTHTRQTQRKSKRRSAMLTRCAHACLLCALSLPRSRWKVTRPRSIPCYSISRRHKWRLDREAVASKFGIWTRSNVSSAQAARKRANRGPILRVNASSPRSLCLPVLPVVRSLPGHRASARCLDFHPYGDFFASGSDDTNIKIFDVRKKGCMQTYKGHAVGVSCIKHSPDGRWLVSGDMHGVVKVWDLSTGKIVTELAGQARSPVVSMDFHPHEFLLAVGGEQSTTIWDMETFSLVGTTPKESSTVRRVAFSKCGRALISASSDALKTWNWDPSMAVQDAVEVGWGSGPLGGAGASSTASQVLADMTEGAVPGKELIGIARNKTILQVYICNISTMVPFNRPIEGEELDPHAAPYQALLDTMPRVSIEESAPAPTFAAAPSSNAHQSILASPMKGFFDAHAASAAGSNGIQVAVPAGPNPYAKLEAQKAAAQQAQREREREQQMQMKADREAAFAAAAASQQQQHYTPAPASSPVRPFQPSHPAQPFVPSQPAASSSSSAAAAAVPYYAGASSSSHKASLAAERAQFQQQAAAAASPAASPVAHGAPSFASQLPPTSKSDRPATAAAAPQPAASTAASSSSAVSAPSPKAVGSAHLRIESEHPVMLKILRARRENLVKLSALWGARGGALGGAKSCVSFVIALNDPAVTVDFLTFAEEVLSKGGVLTLDIARDLLPALKSLLSSKFENYPTTSLRYIRMLLQHFTGVIQSQQQHMTTHARESPHSIQCCPAVRRVADVCLRPFLCCCLCV